MNIEHNPKAYWSFQTKSPKEDVRDILSSMFMKNQRMQSPYEHTPWQLNLFRVEEFEKYKDILEVSKKLNPLRGWDGASDRIPFLSPANMIESYYCAQRLIEDDSNFVKFIEEGKKRNLNYIIQSNHDGALPSAAYNGSVVVYDLLSRISLEVFRTDIAKESKDFRNQLYGYYENSEKQEFKMSDGYCKEVKF